MAGHSADAQSRRQDQFVDRFEQAARTLRPGPQPIMLIRHIFPWASPRPGDVDSSSFLG